MKFFQLRIWKHLPHAFLLCFNCNKLYSILYYSTCVNSTIKQNAKNQNCLFCASKSSLVNKSAKKKTARLPFFPLRPYFIEPARSAPTAECAFHQWFCCRGSGRTASNGPLIDVREKKADWTGWEKKEPCHGSFSFVQSFFQKVKNQFSSGRSRALSQGRSIPSASPSGSPASGGRI